MARQVSVLPSKENCPTNHGNSAQKADGDDTAEIRQKAVQVALAVTSGAYQTSLLTYLIQRDMFPSVMKVCSSSVLGYLRVGEANIGDAS